MIEFACFIFILITIPIWLPIILFLGAIALVLCLIALCVTAAIAFWPVMLPLFN